MPKIWPISTSFSFPTIATSSSRWNYKIVTVAVGLTVLSILFFKIYKRYLSHIATSAKKIPSPPVGNGSQDAFSRLRFKGKPCINEQPTPGVKECAPGIIQFDLTNFQGFEHPASFSIECSENTGQVFFKTCASAESVDLAFYIPNLPLKKEITVTIKYTVEEKEDLQKDIERAIKLTIEQTAGLYTITEDESNKTLTYKTAPLTSKVLNPFYLENPLSLAQPVSFELDVEGKTEEFSTSIVNKNSYLEIANLGERSVIHLLLVSKHTSVAIDALAVTVPVIIGARKTARFSLPLLQDIWAIQYQHATGKNRPKGDLNLQLGGYHQIVYAETSSKHPQGSLPASSTSLIAPIASTPESATGTAPTPVSATGTASTPPVSATGTAPTPVSATGIAPTPGSATGTASTPASATGIAPTPGSATGTASTPASATGDDEDLD